MSLTDSTRNPDRNGRRSAPRRAPRASGIENRQTILRVALDVFATLGFERASTRTIASAAGLEQGHLAYYYPSKEALWRDVIEAFAHECEAPLKEAAPRSARDSPEAIARDVLPRFLGTFAANPQLTRLMLQEFSVSSPRHDWLVENFARPVWLLVKPLLQGLADHGLLSGAEPSVIYFNLIGGALLVFGSPDEIRAIAGVDAADEEVRDQHIRLLLRPLFTAAPEAGEQEP